MSVTIEEVREWVHQRRRLTLHARLQGGAYFEFMAADCPSLKFTSLRQGRDFSRRFFVKDVEMKTSDELLRTLNTLDITDLDGFTARELAQEALAEVAMRQQVYARKETHSQQARRQLDVQIAKMQAIANIFRRAAAYENDAADLFPTLRPLDFGDL